MGSFARPSRIVLPVLAWIALLLAVGPVWAQWDEPAPEGFEGEGGDAAKPPAFVAGLEHEDIGQREVFGWFGMPPSWALRQWRTAAFLERDDARLVSLEHWEDNNSVANLFGARAPLEEMWAMGASRAEVALFGTQAEDSYAGAQEVFSDIGGEITADVRLGRSARGVEGFFVHAAGDTFTSKYESDSGWSDESGTDVLKLVGGVSLTSGSALYLGVTHIRRWWEWPWGEDKDHWNHVQALFAQVLNLDLAVLGDVFAAVGLWQDHKEKEEQTRQINWCAGTFGARGRPTLAAQFTGTMTQTPYFRVNEIVFSLLLDGLFTREDHMRRIGFTEGGLNDLQGSARNPLDFFRDPGAWPLLRPLRDLPDYTRTVGVHLETVWVRVYGDDPQEAMTLDVLAYPMGVVKLASPGFVSPFPNVFWVGFGYDDGLKRWTGRLGVNLVPETSSRVGLRLEVEKRENSHLTAFLSFFLVVS